jgi:serine/threonine-protein kinase
LTWSDWNWAGADAEFKRAIELNPSFPDARAYYSHLLIIMGRSEEAIVQGEKGLELDPLNSLFRSLYANGALLYVHRYDDAIVQARKALQTSPDHPAAQYALWYAYSKKGMYKEALASARACWTIAYSDADLADAFDRGNAEGGYPVAMKRAADALAAHSRRANVIPSDIAGLYEQAGEKEHALEWLEKGFESHDPGMPYLGVYFNSLRSDPHFQDLLRQMNLPR